MSNEGKAVSRLPALPEPPTDPIAADIFRGIEGHGGRILNIHRISVHAPKMFRAQSGFAGALRRDISLSKALCELVIVRTAQLQRCAYVESVHAPVARRVGVSDAKLAALADWQGSALFDGREKAALAHVELMANDGKSVDDASFARLSEIFGPEEIVELSTLCGYYIGTCRMANALGVVPEAG
jgi:AhpD family alkylhydroperoxidase